MARRGDATRSRWLHSKTQAEARGGMVAARHPLAAEAGREILAAGGNAVDAVVAASFAESVVQPAASTIGGGGILCARLGGTSYGVNYLFEAPGGARPDMFPVTGEAGQALFGWSGVKDRLNEIGHLAAAVPGSVAGLCRAAQAHGRLGLGALLKPAIRLAQDGFEMDWYGSLMAGIHLDEIMRFPWTARLLLRDGRYPYRPAMLGPGDVHRQPELAETLRAIATDGADAFYRGAIAQSIADEMARGGGIVALADLARYRALESGLQETVYRGHRVLGHPDALMIYVEFLNILAQFDMAALAPEDPRRLHLIVEIFRRCWHDRMRFSGDRRFVDGPWEELASAAYGAAVAATIDPRRRTGLDHHPDPRGPRSPAPGPASRAESRTVHISAVDRDGGIASLTETVLGNYGCLVATASGVLLNNGMMSFAPVPGHANSIAPGKRPGSNMTPLLVLDPTGRPFLALGASGGRKIITAVLQVLNLVIDHKLGIQEAVAHPRVDLEGERVIVDARLPPDVADDLRAMGHEVAVREEGLSTFEFGNALGLLIEPSGLVKGGVNPFQATAAVGVDAPG